MHTLSPVSEVSLAIGRLKRALAPLVFTVTCMLTAALAPFALSLSASAQDGPAFQQIKLTDAHVTGYLKIAKQLPALFEGLDKAEGKPDQKLQSEIKAVGRAGGFKSLSELEDVVATISFVMSGLDEDGKFVEPAELLKAEMKEIQADKELKGKEKEEMIASIKESITGTPKLEHPGNVDVVKKHQQAIAALFPDPEQPKN